MPAISGFSHAAFTVTDVERSSAWYCDVLGLVLAFGGDDDVVSYRVLADPGSGIALAVRQYHGKPTDTFDEFRTGLDHFSFQVADRAELEAWQAEFERRGDIVFSPIVDTPMASVIVFRDPDNIQLEFWHSSG
jgi:glyoxylase I family protein